MVEQQTNESILVGRELRGTVEMVEWLSTQYLVQSALSITPAIVVTMDAKMKRAVVMDVRHCLGWKTMKTIEVRCAICGHKAIVSIKYPYNKGKHSEPDLWICYDHKFTDKALVP